MARPKRSETKEVSKERISAKPKARGGSNISEYRQVACPMCGTSHGIRNGKNYWSYTQNFDPDKPFGVIQEVGLGQGRSFRVIGTFGPEEDTETFNLVKSRLLTVVGEWRDKGWITDEDIKKVLGKGSSK